MRTCVCVCVRQHVGIGRLIKPQVYIVYQIGRDVEPRVERGVGHTHSLSVYNVFIYNILCIHMYI